MPDAEPHPSSAPPASWLKPLGIALGVTLLVTTLSYTLPDSLAASGVGAAFFVATYYLALRGPSHSIRHFGLSFGGLAEPEPIDPKRLLRDFVGALRWALIASVVIFPFFWVGYVLWWSPAQAFSLEMPAGAAAWYEVVNEVLGQLLVIALPEEMFYRGYLQTTFDDARRPRWNVAGARLGSGVVMASLIFAIGHLATVPAQPARLAVFFPALLFGWLRAKTGGVGAAVLFHALCNLCAALLARGYGLGL